MMIFTVVTVGTPGEGSIVGIAGATLTPASTAGIPGDHLMVSEEAGIAGIPGDHLTVSEEAGITLPSVMDSILSLTITARLPGEVDTPTILPTIWSTTAVPTAAHVVPVLPLRLA
jgi:hypothetical protein